MHSKKQLQGIELTRAEEWSLNELSKALEKVSKEFEEETNSVAKAIIAREEEEAKATANATQEITLLEKTLNKLKTQYGDLEDHIKGVTEAMGEIKSACRIT